MYAFNPQTFTVESVTSGHPDKMCDQISDAILDACLAQDPKSRVAAEVFGANDLLVIGGEITSQAKVDYAQVARDMLDQIGYTENLKIISHVNTQSPDIAQGVNTGGAGDQGIMYGFATNETPEMIQREVVMVHALTRGLEELRKSGISWIKPDGKAQITTHNGRITTVLVSTQHDVEVTQEEIYKTLKEKLIDPIVGEDIEILINPTGKFVIGGFVGDTGLTGRKIMVDTYCGLVPHGGGAFSGKDPTKVDRSAAYMARFAAKNIVAQGLAEKCLVSVAYAIGHVDPLMVEAIDQEGKSMGDIVSKRFDFRPQAIIERLDLRRPIYTQTAAYGHFGKTGLPWEEVAEDLSSSTKAHQAAAQA